MSSSTANFGNTQDLIPIKDLKEGAILAKDGRLLKIIMVSGVNFSLKSVDEQNILTHSFQNFLNGIDFPLQIIVHSRKLNIDHYIATIDKRIEEEPSELLRDQLTEYREFVKAFVAENEIMEKKFFVVVTFSGSVSLASGAGAKFGGIFPFFKKESKKEREKKIQEEAEKNFARNLDQLNQRVAQVEGGIRAMGLETKVLNDQEIVELFYNFYNPETVEREDLELPQETREENAPSDNATS
ncbi:hypothetical protein D6779_06045 [Candidatus Parcubacteria bacterium]|nr:MAG: hypothetical protein D6779_06045 [Candidatus Parcubacteria bacterium]